METYQRYWGPIKGLGSAAILTFMFGLLFAPLSKALFSQALQDEVIIQAIPFVAYFVSVLLLFILGINLIARRFHGRIPMRTYQAVEFTIIAGILFGIIALFQPLNIGPYSYGFSLLLFATLGFILWSHISPRSTKNTLSLAKFTQQSTLIASLCGILVAGLIFVTLTLGAIPKETYGIRQRQWDFMKDEQKQEVIQKAQASFRTAYLPFFIIYGAIPGLVVFFIMREASIKSDAT